MADETSTYDVKIGDECYPLVRDPLHVHPKILHDYLGTNTTIYVQPEQAMRRLLDAVEAVNWFDEAGNYKGRNQVGIGIAGR